MFMINFIHHQVIEKKQKKIYNKHQNTAVMLDYQAVIMYSFQKKAVIGA